MIQNDSIFRETREKLDTVSTSFCLAKWNQVTVHLNSGTTHSCHHCPPHKIPLEEVTKNPSALHNTEEKKNTRKLMLNNERPSECNFCWRVDDLKQERIFSDRIKKSAATWNGDTINTIPQLPWDADVAPKYIEMDFSNTCNFKCIYCSPNFSTTWLKEVKEHGPHRVEPFFFNSLDSMKWEGKMPLEVAEDENPYVQAFWKWLPDIIGNLHNIRVTGGEPLLSKNTFKLIDYFIDHPQPNCQFDINSNLGVPDASIDKLINGINRLYENKAIKEMIIYTSCEAHGAKAEYIRHGLNYEHWLKNVDRILTECPQVKISVMCTYNALSVTSFKDFLSDMLVLIKRHVTPENRGVNGRGFFPIDLDFPYLRYPDFLSAWILTEEYLKYINDCVEFIQQNVFEFKNIYNQGLRMSKVGFSDYALHDIRRLYEVLQNAIVNNTGRNNPVEMDRRSFHKFITENDRRRGSNFIEVFPEMAEFYEFCKKNYR
jgi:organic radical activating enzyme